MNKKRITAVVSLVMIICLGIRADDSLLLHLKFDESSGSIAKDSSGRGHDARLFNPQSEEFGLQGRAIRLNGEDAYIELPLHSDFDGLKNFTCSIWFKAEKFEHGMSLFTRGNYDQGWSTYVFRSFIAMSGKKLQKAAVLYTTFTAGTQAIQPFIHLVITGEPSSDDSAKMAIRYYVDGKLCSSRGGQNTFITEEFLPSPNAPICLGKFGSNSNRWFQGIIDEVKWYRRTLSAEEIARDHEKALSVVEIQEAGQVPELQAVVFKPLSKTRLAIYDLPAEYGYAPLRPIEWFEEQARANGLQPARLDNRKICDVRILNKENYDTLLLPASIMPLECEDTIFQFLAQGGNLITSSIVPSVFKIGVDGTPLKNEKGAIILKQHNRGWFAPFLVRHLDPSWSWAVRKVVNPLTLNPAVAKITGNCLPALFAADAKIKYTPADAWNNVKGSDGSYGDGANFAQAADIKLDLYCEKNGIGSDFIAYRYYNNLIFGSTFVELGKVGGKLLQSDDGAKIFQAVLHLLESRLPEEQAEQYYRDIVKLHAVWSRFGFTYFDTLASLRDAAIFSNLKGEDFVPYNAMIARCEELFNTLNTRRKAQQLQLFNRGVPAEIGLAVQGLLADVNKAEKDFHAMQGEAERILSDVKRPAAIAVKHKYGTIPSIASLTLPTNLNRMRGRLFQSMRDIGVNVFSGQFHEWYVADPAVRENFGSILRDHKLVYPASARYITGGGSFNPSNGSITEGDPVSYPYENLRKHLQNIFDAWEWKGKGNFRIGTADETGLGYQYWGAAAEKDLQEHLRDYYQGDIKNMNDHCNSNYSNFAEIKLPVRQPKSPAEHALWEHWRRLRETKLESLYDNFYKIVKSLNPELDVFHMPSTGAAHSPLYGVNYYNVTKFQDVNAIDGTCCAINHEWLYNDLSRKRNLTSEWGGLYSETPVTYVNSKLWEELSGGALGFEHHVWSFGNDSVSFVDGLDMPRIYGQLMRMTLRDARKIDHLILDGERAAPEIGILFSQTARVHDQGWGWNGEKTFSAHLQSVANYYELFLEYHRSARVVAEEMLMEGTMPAVSVLFVPQAKFLSEEVQKKLLDYAQKGGLVICEGRIGAFDNFGRPSDSIFRELGLVPSFAESRELRIGNAVLTIPESDSVFSPVGEGEVLARIGGSPALVRARYGAGSFVVLGFNPGLQRYAAFPAIIETILRQSGVSAKFIVSDDALVLREWQYGNDRYIILNSRYSDWALQKVTVKVRGRVEIEDYLFGRMVATEYKDGYTSFNTLAVNGARIFRLPGWALTQNQAAPAMLAEARQTPAQFTLAGASSATTDDFQPITLPYQGRLSDSKPLKYGDFVFSLTTLASGSNAKLGEMYLTISKGKESQRKYLKIDQDYYFRLREQIFKVRSSNNFYMYPFYCELSIEAVDSMPAAAEIDVEKKNGEVVFTNSLISFTLNADRGAAITSIKLTDEMAEQTYAGGSCFAATGGLPGPFSEQKFQMKEVTRSAGSRTVEFVIGEPSQGQQLRQTIGLQKDCAGFSVALECRNASQLDQTFDLRWHPKLAIGSAADSADYFFVPADGAVKKIPFRALSSGHGIPPSADWAAVVDTRQKLAYLSTFKKEQLNRVYIWEAADFYTMEIFAPKMAVKAGEALHLELGFFFLRGVTGIDAWQDGVAVHANLPAILNQGKPFSGEIQVAATFNNAESVALDCELWQNGKSIRKLGDFQGSVAFDLPLEFTLDGNLGLLADGQYEFRLSTQYAGRDAFVFSKPVQLAGRALDSLMQAYNDSCRQLESSKHLPAKQIFSLRVMLEELHRAASEGNIDQAEKLLIEYRKASVSATAQ